MERITFSESDCKQETASAWLVAFLQYSLKARFFSLFDNISMKMKKVDYSVKQKFLTLISSIVIGCEYTADVNEKLGSELLPANMLEMEHFPDQSQINILLNRADEETVFQFKDINHQIFMEHSHSLSSNEETVVDFDQTGLIVGGKATYQFAAVGYFPKKKGQKGYKASAAFVGKEGETLDVFLDPGNTPEKERLDDLLETTIAKFKEKLNEGKLIIRGDCHFGSSANIEKYRSIPNLLFVVKGYSTVTPKNLAKSIPFEAYKEVDDSVWVYELPEKNGLRFIIVQIITKDGKMIYSMLITNIQKSKMDAVALFHFYNARQTIEAFFKMAKNVYGIKNLRVKSFYGIYCFLQIVFLTHNLIKWTQASLLQNTKLENVGMRVLVKKVGVIKAFVSRTFEGIIVSIPSLTQLSRYLLNALKPKSVQLQLPFHL